MLLKENIIEDTDKSLEEIFEEHLIELSENEADKFLEKLREIFIRGNDKL